MTLGPAHVLLASTLGVASLLVVACGDLRGADEPTTTDGGAEEASSPLPVSPPFTPDAGRDAASGPSWDDARAALASTRGLGPSIPLTMRMSCSATRLHWRDGEGTIHAWSATARTTTTFTPVSRKQTTELNASDAFVPVDPVKSFRWYAYRAGGPDGQAGELPYDGLQYVGTDDGVAFVKALRDTNNRLSGSQLQLWRPDQPLLSLSDPLPLLTEPPLGIGEGKVVLAPLGAAPLSIYVASLTSAQVTRIVFTGGLFPDSAAPTPSGLLVSYRRSTSGSAIRLYKAFDENKGHELSDELRILPRLLRDAPEGEHDPDGHMASYGDHLLFASAHGIFAYDLRDGAMRALVLHAKDRTENVDMCVMAGAATLAYRLGSDDLGQIFTVPLGGLRP